MNRARAALRRLRAALRPERAPRSIPGRSDRPAALPETAGAAFPAPAAANGRPVASGARARIRRGTAAGRRAATLCGAVGGAALLAACGAGPGAAPQDGGAGLSALPGPGAAHAAPGAPQILLLPPEGADARGWVLPPPGSAAPPLPFIIDGLARSTDAEPAPQAAFPIVFLGGDRRGANPAEMTPRWRAQAQEALRRAELSAPLLTLGRPYAGDPSRWRSPAELAALRDALAALCAAYGWGRVDVMGHSSGAHLAVALAQETGRIRLLAAAAPPLDLLRWHDGGLFGPAAAVRRQYDPIAHVAGLRVDGAALVADPLDAVAPPKAWRGWLREALRLGKPVRLMFAAGGGPERHGLIGPAADALAEMRAEAEAPR